MQWQEWLYDASSIGGHTTYFASAVMFYIMERPEVFYQLIISLLVVSVLIVATRLLHFKDRPAKRPYETVLEKLQASSFPSGHSARITSLLIITGRALQAPYFTLLAVLLVLVVVAGRVGLDKHDIVDSIFGIILGTAVSLSTVLLTPVAP